MASTVVSPISLGPYSNITSASSSFSCFPCNYLGVDLTFATWTSATSLPVLATRQEVIDPNTDAPPSTSVICNTDILELDVYQNETGTGNDVEYFLNENCNLLARYRGQLFNETQPYITATITQESGFNMVLGTKVGINGEISTTDSNGSPTCLSGWTTVYDTLIGTYTGQTTRDLMVTLFYRNITATTDANGEVRNVTSTGTVTDPYGSEATWLILPDLTSLLPIAAASQCRYFLPAGVPKALQANTEIILPASTKPYTRVDTATTTAAGDTAETTRRATPGGNSGIQPQLPSQTATSPPPLDPASQVDPSLNPSPADPPPVDGPTQQPTVNPPSPTQPNAPDNPPSQGPIPGPSGMSGGQQEAPDLPRPTQSASIQSSPGQQQAPGLSAQTSNTPSGAPQDQPQAPDRPQPTPINSSTGLAGFIAEGLGLPSPDNSGNAGGGGVKSDGSGGYVVSGDISLPGGGSGTTVAGARYSGLPSGVGVQIVEGGVTSTAAVGEPSGPDDDIVVLPGDDGFRISDQTASAGGPEITVSGATISALPAGSRVVVVSDGRTATRAIAPTSPAILAEQLPSLPGQPAAYILADGQTVTAGGSAVMISGVTVSAAPGAGLVAMSGDQATTLFDAVASATGAAYILENGQTVVAGGQAVTVLGTVYTALPSGAGVLVAEDGSSTTIRVAETSSSGSPDASGGVPQATGGAMGLLANLSGAMCAALAVVLALVAR